MHFLSSKKHTEDQSFLLTGPEPSLHPGADNRNKELDTALLDESAPVFPAPRPPKDVLAKLSGWPHFTGLAIRMDTPDEAALNSALAADITFCLDTITKREAGVWFQWDTTLFGCVLPGPDAASAEMSAREIQGTLSQKHLETVSIGMTRFPLLDYDAAATLQNCCKALDHAAFFGPGSIVMFDAVSLNISGDNFYQDDRMEEALQEYRDALRLNPADVNVLNSLGVCLAQMKDYAGARASFNNALALTPDEAMAIYNLGVLDLIGKDGQQALARFKQAYAIDSEPFEIPFHIGKLLTEQKAYEAARPYLTAAIERCDTHAPAYALLGKGLAAAGQIREAIAAYKKAVKLSPNDAAALSALGVLYDKRGENPEICLTFSRQSVALCPENGLFRRRLARMYQKHNQLEAALGEYETAAALGQDVAKQISEIQQMLETANDEKQRCA